jgi:hypothetical protein
LEAVVCKLLQDKKKKEIHAILLMTKGETVHMGKTGASEGDTFPFMIRVKRRTMARIEFARP